MSIVAEKICAELAKVFMIDGSSFQIFSSIGIACYPENGKEPLELVQAADHAMYKAKHHGGDKVVFATHR